MIYCCVSPLMDGLDSLRDLSSSGFRGFCSSTTLTLQLFGSLGLQGFSSLATSTLREFDTSALQLFGTSNTSTLRLFGISATSTLREFRVFNNFLMLKLAQFCTPEWTRSIDLIGLMDHHCRNLTCLFPEYEFKMVRSGLLRLSTGLSYAYKKVGSTCCEINQWKT
jgi:hypothetical protein